MYTIAKKILAVMVAVAVAFSSLGSNAKLAQVGALETNGDKGGYTQLQDGNGLQTKPETPANLDRAQSEDASETTQQVEVRANIEGSWTDDDNYNATFMKK